MTLSTALWFLFFCVVAMCILVVFIFTPIVVMIQSFFSRRGVNSFTPITPPVSMIIVVRNAEALILDKIRNSLSLAYPSSNFEVIIVSDGSTDKTEEIIGEIKDSRIIYISTDHEGKNSAINKAVAVSKGDILILSDTDALLDHNAVMHLVKWFSQTDIGGVCGNNIISDTSKTLSKAQTAYMRFDRLIKTYESRMGSISVKTGKVSAIRRSLFRLLPSSVADDIFIPLSIIQQGYRFIFEPEAKAYIRTPSRNPFHEIMRRRRIVNRSLTGIYMFRELLNPFRHGMFSLTLFINKVMRRLLPFFLMMLFFSNLYLVWHVPLFRIFFAFQVVFYGMAVSYWTIIRHVSYFGIVRDICSLVFYFCLGNYGTLLGVFDFMRGKRVIQWEPIKVDVS